jgi:NADPH:quinone reductase
LELRDVPIPADPPNGHLLVQIEACAINHGDKVFLARPVVVGGLQTSAQNIWGASGSGRVLSAGPGVPAGYPGRNAAIYRSLTPSPHIVGLWSELVVVPYTSCVILPDNVAPQDYSGSLVNVTRLTPSLSRLPLKATQD